jgi:HK97 family phage major capsid protein
MPEPAVAPKSIKRELPDKLPMQYRAFAVRAASDTDDGLVPLTFSSPNPVKRMMWGGMWWNEILSHAAGAVKTDRLTDPGIALLVNHDPNQRAGILQDGVIDSKGGRGNARFNTTQFGKDTATEVREATLPWVSVGYLVHDENRIEDFNAADDEDPDYLGTFEASSWEPVEVSLVAVPADPTVGVGRDLSKLPLYPVRFAGMPADPPAPALRSTQEIHMPEPIIAVVADHTEALKTERERVAGIGLLLRQFPDVLTRELFDKAINEGLTRDAVAAQVLESKRAKEVVANAGGPVVLTDKEARGYDFLAVMRGDRDAEKPSFEREVSQALGKALGRDTGGIFVPTMQNIFRMTSEEKASRTRAGLYTGTSTAGGATVATELISFLDFLRPALRLTGLGAEFMGGCTANFALPKMTGDAGFNWVGENPGNNNTDVDPTFGQVYFSPLQAIGSTSWSRQLLVQSSTDIEAKVRNALILRAAIGIETAALQGTGGTQPTGLLSTTGVHVVAIGANGGTPDKQNYIDMLTACFVANAAIGEQKYLLTPEIAGYLAGQPELGNTIALPTFTYGADGKGRINGHDAAWSNLLPKTLTKGTSTADCHAAIGGSFSALTIAEWGAMEIVLDPYTSARQGMINIIASFLVDSNCTYPQAFSVLLDQLV